MNIEYSLPPCPDCGAYMMTGYQDGVWACRACGATFMYNHEYQLQPYLLEIHYPACPECGADMIASSAPQIGPSTTWTCKRCGETIHI